MKRLLLVMNPCSGTKKANPHLTEILQVFSKAGYECTVHLTRCRGDATEVTARLANDVDLVVCIGGDGTFNETVSGVLQAGAQTPVGYIPAGSTNDFASSLKLSKHVTEAAQDIVRGTPVSFDVGRFADRYFTYVASFGAFTRTSYATSQSVKNALGHLAYILGGIKELSSIHSYHVRAELDGERQLEGDYIFGAISNSTSVGGVLTLDESIVDLSDGQFEVLLIHKPKNLLDLTECIRALTSQDYRSRMLSFASASRVCIHTDEGLDWTLDGEYAQGEPDVEAENLHNAIRVMLKRETL